MKTRRLQSGVYQYIDSTGLSFVLRGGSYWDTNKTSWIANQCSSLEDCSDNNSCCIELPTKKMIIGWIEGWD